VQLPADRYIDVDGLRLRYWLEGDAGPNLVLIHGIGGAVDVWRKQFERLPLTHRVLALDLPGCGRSAIPPDYPPDTLRMLAAAVRAVMQAAGMSQAAIVGSSLGGAVTIEFAMGWPEMVSSLVLIGPAGMTREVAWPLRLMSIRGVGELLTLPDRTRTAHAIRGCVADPTAVTEEDIDRAFAMATLPGVQDAFLRLLRAYANVRGLNRNELRRLQAGMRTIHAPTLVIWGEQDQILPITGAKVALERFPNAVLIARPNSGHLVFVEEPVWFDEIVADFVHAPEAVLNRVHVESRRPDSANLQPEMRSNKAFNLSPAPFARHLTMRTIGMAAVALALFVGVRFIRQQSG
jgi:4,5:9,10-diseco-3-hydroxy-5,9,17-trioxoandrosta-1(10),2-diene-4-oate hydrolase